MPDLERIFGKYFPSEQAMKQYVGREEEGGRGVGERGEGGRERGGERGGQKQVEVPDLERIFGKYFPSEQAMKQYVGREEKGEGRREGEGGREEERGKGEGRREGRSRWKCPIWRGSLASISLVNRL